MKAEELRKINVLKKSGRYATLISEIEEIIKTISEKGGRDFTNQKYSAFYLHGEDVILFEDLMQYFTGQGFKTKEFQGWGIHLSW